ncbi:hypothetical protein ACFLXF_03365, partial [Chloroflexota bacterium]
AVMVPKGLAAVVLASIPLQQGILGGELIKNITYGVVLLSIVITSFMVMLLDKTGLYELYGWLFSPKVPGFLLKTSYHTKTRYPIKEALDKSDKITPTGPKLFGSQKRKDNDS